MFDDESELILSLETFFRSAIDCKREPTNQMATIERTMRNTREPDKFVAILYI